MNILLFCLIMFISVFLSFLGDIIVIKTRLKNCERFIAEIIYFDEVHFVKGSSSIVVVKYIRNNIEKNAILHRAKKDRIGDRIEIVTDGSLAARNEVVLKEDMSIGVIFVSIIIMFLFSQSNYNIETDYALLALITMLVIVVLLALIHPYMYESYDREIKDKLGWHDK